MNRRHKAAQHAQRASVNLHTLLFFKWVPSWSIAVTITTILSQSLNLIPKYTLHYPFLSLSLSLSSSLSLTLTLTFFLTLCYSHSLYICISRSIYLSISFPLTYCTPLINIYIIYVDLLLRLYHNTHLFIPLLSYVKHILRNRPAVEAAYVLSTAPDKAVVIVPRYSLSIPSHRYLYNRTP